MTSLEGKAALVTGASRGIGRAVAQSLAAAGVGLGLASRSGDDLGLDDVVARPCDVREPADLERIVEEPSSGSDDWTSSSPTPGSAPTARSSSSRPSTSTR